MTLAEDGYKVKESTLEWSQDGDQVSVELADGSMVVFVRDKNTLKAPVGGTTQTLYRQNEAVRYSESPAASAADESPVAAPSVDTSGTYEELVERANGLYDQGSMAFQREAEGASEYFAAAALVYAAAWEEKATDPKVGTDFATALFYAGDSDGAIRQIDAVLAAHPEQQSAWLNKGIFLDHAAKLAEQASPGSGADWFRDARAAYEETVGLGETTAAGQQAQQQLAALPQQ